MYKLLSFYTKSLLVVCLLCLPAAAQENIEDPWEDYNRSIHWFNDNLDWAILEPLAEGYDYILPMPIQNGVGNFFETLRYPKYLANDLLQGKFTQAAEHTGRFLINVLLGVGGFIDVAKHVGLPAHAEDFGLTLATWGFDHGSYIVLPFFGPSSIRDGIGRLVDVAFDPLYWVFYTSAFKSSEEWPISLGARFVEAVHDRAQLLEGMDTLRESSLDLYLSMQSSYYQYRRGVLYDGNPPDEDESWMDDEELE